MKNKGLKMLFIICGVLLTGCNEHVHTFSDTYSYDKTSHWKVATCEHDIKDSEGLHEFSEWCVSVQATETAPGSKWRECKICHYGEKEVIPQIEHKHTYSATWTSNDTSHWHDSTCEHDVKDGEESHTFSEWMTVISASEHNEGLQERYCTVCNYRDTNVLDKLEHVHTGLLTQYLNDSYSHWNPSTCGHDVKVNETPHTYGEWHIIQDVYGDQEGLKERYCIVCNYRDTESLTLAEHTHKFDNTTWYSDENGHWNSSLCGHDVKANETPHTYGEWNIIQDVYGDQEGLKERYCIVCNYRDTESLTLAEHTHKFDNTTLYSDENGHWHPSTCGHDVKVNETPHTYGEWHIIQDVYGDQEGLKERYCIVCNYSEMDVLTIEEHTHKYSDTWSFDSESHYHEDTCGHNTKQDISSHTLDENEVCTVCSYSHTSYDKLIFSEIVNNECKVIGLKDNTVKEIIIPKKYNGANVVGIEENAFSGKWEIVSIEIPDGVKSIGDNAFSDCSSLTSINIPNSVTSIGENAFKNCSSLTSINIPDSVTSIGYDAFYSISNSCKYNEYDNAYYLGNENNPYLVLVKAKDKSITSCNIHSNTKFVLNSAFVYCSSLTNVLIPSSVTSIGACAFLYCSSLTSINIPNSVTSIGDGAFNFSSTSYEYDNAYYLGNENNPYLVLVKVKDESITSCNIHSNTKFILQDAFKNCSSLTSINIPDSVTSIGENAFKNCSSLTSINIPNSVTSIGGHAFYDCSSLTSINIPDSVTSIGNYAFKNCSSLTSINIPNSVTSIGENAFSYCNSLESIVIPDSVTSIGGGAFSYCSSLTSINIPDSVTSIGGSAFYNCRSLESIVIPDSVTSIGDYVFYYCANLQYIYCEASEMPYGWSENWLSNVPAGVQVVWGYQG